MENVFVLDIKITNNTKTVFQKAWAVAYGLTKITAIQTGAETIVRDTEAKRPRAVAVQFK